METNRKTRHRRRPSLSTGSVAVLCLVLGIAPVARAQDRPDTTAGDDETVDLQLKGDVELLALVHLFSRTLDLRVVFDAALLDGKTISIAGTERLGRTDVRDLLHSALAAHDLALEKGDRPGWLRVVPEIEARREVRIYVPVHGEATALARAARSVFGAGSDEVPAAAEDAAGDPAALEPDDPAAEVRFTVDESTNTIIIDTRPHRMAEVLDLLERIDRKQHQVLVECIVVSADVSDETSYGFEAWHKRFGQDGPDRLLSQLFGISTIDSNLDFVPGVTPGFNAVVLRPSEYALAVYALQTTTKARVLAAPRLLVRDSAEGTIESIQEHPFVSINASNTVATTAFEGFETAGPQLTIEPTITEGDSLHLDYTVRLSNFTAPPPSPESPPPRKTDLLRSSVVVPDGHTVVVGGLEVEAEQEIVDRVPILSHIPIIGELFKFTTTVETRSRLFVFIRPSIIRDDQFLDLKGISRRDIREAELDDGDPSANPVELMGK